MSGMNAAVRATVRVGIYTGAKVYFVHEVCTLFEQAQQNKPEHNTIMLVVCKKCVFVYVFLNCTFFLIAYLGLSGSG